MGSDLAWPHTYYERGLVFTVQGTKERRGLTYAIKIDTVFISYGYSSCLTHSLQSNLKLFSRFACN